MSNAVNGNTDHQALLEKYEDALHRVVHMRKNYPASCAAYLSSALSKDADMMMKAEVIPTEKLKEVYSPQYLENAKLEKLNLKNKTEPPAYKIGNFDEQISDIRCALNQIRAARHKNVQD